MGPLVGRLGLGLGGLTQSGHLLGECPRELELADHALGHERLAEALTRLALPFERLLELLLGDEPALDEDLPETTPAGVVLRPRGAAELRPLLGDDARELLARDAEALDEDLTELLPGLVLELEGHTDLALGDEAPLDEERADETRLKRLRNRHVHTYRQSLELAIG